MRVLVVAAWPPWPLTDGARMVLHHQLRHLASRHDIRVIAPRRGDLDREVEAVPGVEVLQVGAGPTRGAWLAARLASAARREPVQVARVLNPAVRAAVTEAVGSFAPDVIHLFGWGTAALSSELDGPCIHTAIDSWTKGRLDAATSGRRGRAKAVLEADQGVRIRRHERRHYPRCRAVVVVSDDDAAAVRTVAPTARVVVIPNGVDPGAPVNQCEDPDLVGFHGALANRANLGAARFLVDEVLPAVRRRRPGTRLLVAGRGATELGAVPDWAEVAADVDEMRPVIDRMAVHAAPMLSGTGIKNKVLEAMAAGRPVVTNARGLGGVGEGDGIVVAESVDGLADAIAGLLADPARRREIGAAGRRRVERSFSWEAAADAVEALWAEVAVAS